MASMATARPPEQSSTVQPYNDAKARGYNAVSRPAQFDGFPLFEAIDDAIVTGADGK